MFKTQSLSIGALTSFGLAAAMLTLAGTAGAAPLGLIDVHVHYNGELGVLDGLLQKLNGVNRKAFLLTTPLGLPSARAMISAHPDRFVGFGDVKLDDSDILAQIDRLHAAGFRGLGEITGTQKDYDDKSYWPIYDRAAQYHMILLFHTGIVNRLEPSKPSNISFDRSRVTRLDLIARHWPTLIVIGTHLGNPDYAEAAEIGRWDPNLYFDMSGTTLIKKEGDYGFFKANLLVDGHQESSYTKE